MTEAEVRALLRSFDGVGGIEVWISLQHWKAVPGGWSIAKELEGRRSSVALVPEGVRISAMAPGGSPPAVWVIGRDPGHRAH
jgi:hypothetical protein